ncbi:hypothetical protein BH11ARM2_BH11ARM2_30800 [soil metagenome]
MPIFALPIATPYAMRAPAAVGEVVGLQEAKRREMSDLRVPLGATYDNPFDPADVTLDLLVTPPQGDPYTVPGYLGRDYTRELKDGVEALTPNGPPVWRIRWTPEAAGATKVVFRLKDRTGMVQKSAIVAVANGDGPGFARISPRDGRFFETEDGKPYYPLGANVGWGGPKGTYDYDDWFSRYGAAGANFARVWLSPDWTTFGLERTGKREDGLGMGQYDLANAWRLDQVMDDARRSGMRLMLCIDSFNILRQGDGNNYWEKTPHNVDNGGPLRVWTDFWTSSEMERLYKAKLRYLVARYGARPETFAWEFWNEADLVSDFDPTRLESWLRKMGDWMRANDPYAHPITSSFGKTAGYREIDTIPQLDFVQTHCYNAPDLVRAVTEQIGRKSTWNKPHFIGEVGADSNGPRTEDDPQGMQIHDPLWVSLATGASGGAMPWWWDNYIAPKDLYSLFQAASRYVKGIDWADENFRIVTPTFAYQIKPAAPRRADLRFENGPTSFNLAAFNRPRTVWISRSGKVTGQVPISGILHGMVNHPALHNPVRFKVDLPRKTRFEVLVSNVSGYGGAALRVELDGAPVMTRLFDDKEPDKHDDIHTYDGAYGFDVPAGTHTLLVENAGADWMEASYRFGGLIEKNAPPLEAWGVVGNGTALVWLRVEGRTWRRVCVEKKPPLPAPPTVLGLRGLPAGRWRTELWDTYRGETMTSRTVIVKNDGKIRIPLPTVMRDMAIKLVHEDH